MSTSRRSARTGERDDERVDKIGRGNAPAPMRGVTHAIHAVHDAFLVENRATFLSQLSRDLVMILNSMARPGQ